MATAYVIQRTVFMDRGGGQVVSMLAFYSDNPSSNPPKKAIFCKI